MSNKWEFLDSSKKEVAEDTRPSLTYAQDVWKRFKKNILAMIGLVMLATIVILAILGPMFTPYNYDTQIRELSNMPPRLPITQITENDFVYITPDYTLINVTSDGHLVSPAAIIEDNFTLGFTRYQIGDREVIIDYSFANVRNQAEMTRDPKLPLYDLYVDNFWIDPTPVSTVSNKTFMLGSDNLGRDLWTRNLYGARISLSVGVIAALISGFVGVIYGGIAGYKGGYVDNVMMRIVDLLTSIPLTLLVILITVIVDSTGVITIIVTIGMIYWVDMARQVRGQVLSLKEQEFVLAARTLGASAPRIIFKHLIPNALGPIVVTMMMSIPSAIFTESFLSFIGLGVSIPMASWGSLANDALGGIRSYPYLLIVPSFTIAFTMFAFNFVGDGLRDALDPKQRK